MTKKFFFTLAFGILLSVTNLDYSYAQRWDDTKGCWVEAPSLDQYLKGLSGHFNRLSLEYYYKQDDKVGNERSFFYSAIEFLVIQKGKSTRLKWCFNNSKIVHIEIEGVGATTPEDIKKGEFTVTVSPEQTTLYRVNVHKKGKDGSIKVYPGYDNRRVIVVEDRRTLGKVYDNIWWINIKKGNLSSYLDSLAGGVPSI
jgi:hypothetical protein